MRQIVVWDPEGVEPEGEVVEASQAQPLIAKKVVLLPYEIELAVRNGVSAWSKRSWGQGVSFDGLANKRGCPIVLYLQPGGARLHWAFRIAATHGGEAPAGRIRLATDKNQIGTFAFGMKSPTGPVQVERLGEPDRWGGWTVSGEQEITTRGEGFFGLSLYGRMTACRVSWLAVSQTR